MENINQSNVELLLKEVIKACYEDKDTNKVSKVVIDHLESNDPARHKRGIELIAPIVSELLK